MRFKKGKEHIPHLELTDWFTGVMKQTKGDLKSSVGYVTLSHGIGSVN